MAQEALVDSLIEGGRKVLEALDQANLAISVALWLFHEGSEQYRLVLASPLVNKRGARAAYLKIAEILDAGGLRDALPVGRVQAVRTDDPFVKALRRIVRTKSGEISGVRLANNYVNDVAISDAYVYRAA
ncbi:hypothetical protein RAS1_20320 [Phycisphaerae bacterium RAS1]|nr:hypothetical protein RAS1_20320 [Phycisphaerae bacterium RAS1]